MSREERGGAVNEMSSHFHPLSLPVCGLHVLLFLFDASLQLIYGNEHALFAFNKVQPMLGVLFRPLTGHPDAWPQRSAPLN